MRKLNSIDGVFSRLAMTLLGICLFASCSPISESALGDPSESQIGGTTGGRDASTSRVPNSHGPLSTLLPWLPPDTESIVAMQGVMEIKDKPLEDTGDYPAPPPISNKPDPNPELTAKTLGLEFEELMREQSLGIFPESSHDLLNNQRIVATLMAVHSPGSLEKGEYVPPLLGPDHISFRTCQFGKFADESGQTVLAQLEKDSKHQFELHGFRIIQLENQWFAEHAPALYYTVPHPKVVIAATDLNYLDRVLKRIEQRKTSIDMNHVLSLGKHIDLASPVWAIRQYPKTSKRGHYSMLNMDQEAQALGFCYQRDAGNKVAFVYTSKSPDAGRHLERLFFGHLEIELQSNRITKNTHNVSYRLSKESGGPALLLLSMFGTW